MVPFINTVEGNGQISFHTLLYLSCTVPQYPAEQSILGEPASKTFETYGLLFKCWLA